MANNGIASPEDFRKLADEKNPPERVVLPKSGLAVLLRRPTTFAVWMLDQKLEDLGSRIQDSGPAAEPKSQIPNPKSYLEWRNLIRAAVEQAFVQPKLSLTPGPNEIHPSWLPEEDQVYVLRWIRGLIAPDGTDLVEKFFRERGGREPSRPATRDEGAVALPGAGGGDPAYAPVESAGDLGTSRVES